jgi:hypothetical protein
MKAIIPKIERAPEGATQTERVAMFRKWCERLVAANPDRFLPQGVRRRWWHIAKLEHPLTRQATH